MKELNERIDPSKIVIARRWSKLEWEANSKGLSEEKLLAEYEKVGLKDKKWESHLRQLDTFNKLHTFLGKPHFTVGETMKRSDFSGADLVVIEGGDGHFSFTSHFLENEKAIGVVADSLLSKAVLYDFYLNEFISDFPKILTGEYKLEAWTRLQATLNGIEISEKALSEFFVGAKFSCDMSRYTLSLKNSDGTTDPEEQKTSGILVSTGTGSTGWMKKATLTQQRIPGIFPRGEKRASFIIREEPTEQLSEYKLVHGELKVGESLEITSLAENVISPDSYKAVMYDFPFGAKATIEIASQPLNVIRKGN